MLVFDDQLNVTERIDLFNVEYGKIPGTGSLNVTNLPILTPLENIGWVGDTLFCIRKYFTADTLAPSVHLTGSELVLEKIRLETGKAKTLPIIQNTYTSITFTDDKFFASGIFPSDENFLFGAVAGSFTLDGRLIQRFDFDPPGESDFNSAAGHGGVIERKSNRIYSGYVGGGSSPDCPTGTTVIDQRDLEFNFIRRKRVPDCHMVPGGSNCFAFDSKGNVFYQTESSNDPNGDINIGLYKYDTSLNLIWKRVFDFPENHRAFSVSETDDDGVILETVVTTVEGWTWKLYKVDASGNVVSSVERSLGSAGPVFYPNPFRDGLSLSVPLSEEAVVLVRDASGRVCAQYVLSAGENRIEAGGLPAGWYVLELLSAATGARLGWQKVVKE